MPVAMKDGKVLLRNGLVSCSCCPQQLTIKYSWEGTGQFDLDTKTEFLSEAVGWSCGDSGVYVLWLPGGNGGQDDTSENGFERVDVRVDTAHDDLQWTSSVNIELYAGWYIPAGGTGNATVTVKYNGVTDSKIISPGSQSDCASTSVGTITVYDDGTFDLS